MIDKILATVAMFAVIIALLLSSFQIAIYGDPNYKFYEKEYLKYNVTEALTMEIEDVMEVTDYMMAYLIGEKEELSIVTEVDGKTQDFFNEQDRIHMADVKNLFLGGLMIRNILAIVSVLILGILFIRKVNLKEEVPKAYTKAFGVFLGVLAFLAIAFTVDFTACFTIFHEIFFTNDLWIFDPRTDYMIRMLPEGFFADMVLKIAVLFVTLLMVVFLLLHMWKKSGKHKQ